MASSKDMYYCFLSNLYVNTGYTFYDTYYAKNHSRILETADF